MDGPQEEMQYVGFFGIFKETFKVIFSWKKIFTQVTLSLILPLTIMFLAHMNVSNLLYEKIEYTEDKRNWFGYIKDSQRHKHYSRKASAQLAYFWLFEAAYFTFHLVFSLLSRAAVVYTIASIYTGRDVTYKKVMKVVPRVYKRVFVTFISMYVTLFVYTVIGAIILILITVKLYSVPSIVMFFMVMILLAIGLFYMSIVWQMASVVTVLESASGFKAMVKGNNLLKGKRWVAIGIFFFIFCILVGIVFVYPVFVVRNGVDLNILPRILLGFWCLVALLVLFVFGLVIQTILYLACKSHHRETIDKLSLSTYLGAYLGEYQGLQETKDIQLGQPQV